MRLIGLKSRMHEAPSFFGSKAIMAELRAEKLPPQAVEMVEYGHDIMLDCVPEGAKESAREAIRPWRLVSRRGDDSSPNLLLGEGIIQANVADRDQVNSIPVYCAATVPLGA